MMKETKGRFERKEASAPAVPAALTAIVCSCITGLLLCWMLLFSGSAGQSTGAGARLPDFRGRFQQHIMNSTSLSLEGVVPIRRSYKLEDGDLAAPKANPANFGEADSLEAISWLPEKASQLLEGQDTYFTEFAKTHSLRPDSKVRYYLDDTIMVVTWKEVVGYGVFTFAEVKIADGSQFRRFLAGGEFGSEKRFTTTEMSESVNAVLASSGDFYKFRYSGVVVYGNTVRRVNTNKADTCYINDAGDLLFTYQNSKMTMEEAQQFVDDNNIRFSITFGPVLVDNGQRCEPATYDLGEVNEMCPRAALCQLDELHYLLVTSNAEEGYPGSITIHTFAERIAQTGCDKAYALDGGQTAAIALDHKLVNQVLFGQQRPISDIIYFATALPDGG